MHNTPLSDSLPLVGVSSYTLKWWLKEHPMRSSRGVDIQTPQTAVLKHPIFNSEDRELIRRARRDGREAREERGLRKGATLSSSPQGMTSWSSSIKIWFFSSL